MARRVGSLGLAVSMVLCGCAQAPRGARAVWVAHRDLHLAAAPRCARVGATRSGHVRPGGTLALAPREDLVAAVDTDNDRVVLVGLGPDGAQSEHPIAVGHRPQQAALGSDGRMFVTERADRTVSVYDTGTGRRLCRTDAGIDPVGIALAPDEATIVVTSGMDHQVTAVDTDTFDTRFTVSVPREPRGIAIAADGTRAFVAHIAGEPLSMVDLTADAPKRALSIPHVPIVGDDREPDVFPAFAPRPVRPERRTLTDDQRRVAADMGEDANEAFPPRAVVRPFPSQAWSLAIDERTQQVVVPFVASRTGNNTLIPIDEDLDGPVSDEYGGGVRGGPTGAKLSFALGVFDIRSGNWSVVALPSTGFGPGDTHAGMLIPSSVALAPDGTVVVTAMGTDALAVLEPGTASFTTHTVQTVSAPCGVVLRSDGTVVTFSQFIHTLEVRVPQPDSAVDPAEAASGAPQPFRLTATRATDPVRIGESSLDPILEEGRRLFHRANDRAISTDGLSCGGCHPDGRDDGLVWFLPAGARQTPTLGGRLEHPFNWNGTQDVLENNIAQTIHRLGGTGLTPHEVSALAAYVTRGLPVPERPARALTAEEAHGRDLFSGRAACDGCHQAERNYTDGAGHALPGNRFREHQPVFDTPSLRFVDGTAPYFHDGRFATLDEVLTSHRHHMGHADTLDVADLGALEAYLRTL